MTALSKNAELKFNLGGQNIDYPLNARDLQIYASFENGSVQANISTEEFEFVLEEAKKIRDYISNGENGGVGIFEGMPFNISAYNKDNSYLAFDGFLDLSNGFVDSETKVLCNIKKSNGLNSLNERLSALSLGFLESKGVIGSSEYQNFKYVVYKDVELFEILMANIVLFLLIKELVQSIKDTAAAIANAVAMIAIYPSGGLGAILYSVAIALIQAAYTTALVIAINDLVEKLIKTLVPPLVDSKALKYRATIEKIAGHLGYAFESPIPELDTTFYVPSNHSLEEGLSSAIPKSDDYGYRCIDFFELMQTKFNAKFALIGNVLHLRTEADPFWITQSTWTLPDVKTNQHSYNTEEFQANRIVQFNTDLSDSWTIVNFTGTNYEAITDANTVTNTEAKYLKGLDFVNIPLALGNRKDELTPLEKVLAEVAGAADSLINTFGGSSNLEGLVTGKIGYLKVSQNDYSVPKSIVLSGQKLPLNHRDILSAKVLYNKYHSSKSFVSNNYYGQKYDYTDIKIPFGFEDFIQLINNSYFYTNDGQEGKIVDLKWNMLQDFAIGSYWIRKPYTKNLKETFIEA